MQMSPNIQHIKDLIGSLSLNTKFQIPQKNHTKDPQTSVALEPLVMNDLHYTLT